jgi:uridine kinase
MILAISGGSGSGKTTLSHALQTLYYSKLNIRATVVSMDNYYKNIFKEKFDNYDHPTAFNMELLHHDLSSYLSTGTMIKRSYDYITKTTKVLETATDVQIVILEGLYAFYEKPIRDLCTFKLYLDVDEKTRVQRRVLRDLKERNISKKENMEMIDAFVQPMYEKYIVKQKNYSDKVNIL